MPTLDNIAAIQKLDKQGMVRSIEALGQQCRQAWNDVRDISIPAQYKKAKNIHLCGMGGSALGADVAWHAFQDRLQAPFTVTNQYNIPAWVTRNTVCIVSSYSGTTEEVVASFRQARKRNAKIIVICAGGTLAQMARRYRIPAYVFDPRHNPSDQPRMALGYSLIGIAALLRQAGLLQLSQREVYQAVDALDARHGALGLVRSTAANPAKRIANAWHHTIPIVIASEHLSGNAHIAANQINENGKNFAAYFLVSEMNHHLMEGLSFPRRGIGALRFFFYESKRYDQRIQRRMTITKKVLRKKGIHFDSYVATGPSPVAEVLDAMAFSSYASLYLAMCNDLDPSPIPMVDYFKAQLKK